MNWVQGDATNIKTVEDVLKNSDAAVHAIGTFLSCKIYMLTIIYQHAYYYILVGFNLLIHYHHLPSNFLSHAQINILYSQVFSLMSTPASPISTKLSVAPAPSPVTNPPTMRLHVPPLSMSSTRLKRNNHSILALFSPKRKINIHFVSFPRPRQGGLMCHLGKLSMDWHPSG